MREKVLIIGGSYFIGKKIAETMLKKGYEVTLLNRGTREPFSKEIKQICADRGNLEQMKTALAGKCFDYVVETSFYDLVWSEILLNSFENIKSIKAFVYISSSAVYDAENLTIPFKENDNLSENKYWTLYGKGKLETEKLYRGFFSKTNVRLAILRPPYVYGEENYAQRESFVFNHIINDIPLVVPSSDCKLQFIYSGDLAEIVYYFLSQNNEKEIICNVGNKEPVSCSLWVEKCSEAVGKKAAVISFDYKANGFADRDFFPFYDYDNVLDVTKINKLIQAETPFLKGLKTSFQWFMKNKDNIPFKENVEENIQKILKIAGAKNNI